MCRNISRGGSSETPRPRGRMAPIPPHASEEAYVPALLNESLPPADAECPASPLFPGAGLFGDLDFSAMKETDPDQLFAAWFCLPDGQRNEMDAEFQDIFE